jgi:2-polyprenyl-3-methyl-5-hydroxy-6-metoxy-1,4-benzoquinol methylase
VADLFAEKAQDWDKRDLVRTLSAAVSAAILDHVALDEAMHVLDFGAGTGLITAHLHPHVGKITAVDTSEAMLDKLAAKEELKGKVAPLCVDIVETPIDARFDLIVSAMALHHVKDTDLAARRFAEHLKPDARIALADLDAEDGSFHTPGTEGVFHSGFDRADLQAILERNGFRDVRFVTAHTVVKDTGRYPVFLVTATKR